MFAIRPYQQAAIDALYAWWMSHPGIEQAGILWMPTGAGKSIVIAELVRLLFDTWPEEQPRTLILVPSKELAEQNMQKLRALLPAHLRLGFYSASVGQKRPDADVIVATIGSVARVAHVLGNIKCVVIDECHLVNPDGAGMYRALLDELAQLCQFRVVGLTATPFRGNGVWLTDGTDPLFTGIAHQVGLPELLELGHLAPLIRPIDAIQTHVDTTGIAMASTGDFSIDELSERVAEYLPAAAAEAAVLAATRRKWIAFLPTVRNAEAFVRELRALDIEAALVCGETPKREREQLIADFRAGRIRCLVTVLALATGFDVPDVDCILWLRPTVSPVLYIQGAGRGMRPGPGKTDCLWLDFSDTTERMGPIDLIRGRKRPRRNEDAQAPFAVCKKCSAQVRPASAMFCPECGEQLREDEEKEAREVSNAPVMSHQKATRIVRYEVTRATYARHKKDGRADSVRVDYWGGMRRVASEWACFEHTGFARAKAERWWQRRAPGPVPRTVTEALGRIQSIACPRAVVVNEVGRWPEIVRVEWEAADAHAKRA
jgi:DNA repair protein RadD